MDAISKQRRSYDDVVADNEALRSELAQAKAELVERTNQMEAHLLAHCDERNRAERAESALKEQERVIEWRPIETAPKGYPALEQSSEWFLARGGNGPKGFNVAVIRRCFGHGFGPWECTGDAYYKADFFTHWMPIPALTPPPESEKPQAVEGGLMKPWWEQLPWWRMTLVADHLCCPPLFPWRAAFGDNNFAKSWPTWEQYWADSLGLGINAASKRGRGIRNG